ncbi:MULTISPECIES: hypothetical protein [Amycolatopsis]|uniref:Uncharacterized protein n=1 Tax=Amycolatopsis bullii TaxID=941987 RepID=A0ABQ3KRX7_9PSEU|nr:hypothetical protein [Amycolatopsis bullii]GHG50183.1 hypothetical protein GCM10017567_86240 [Amycolatopsis bullii]
MGTARRRGENCVEFDGVTSSSRSDDDTVPVVFDDHGYETLSANGSLTAVERD